jgi:hypothetical protein
MVALLNYDGFVDSEGALRHLLMYFLSRELVDSNNGTNLLL